MSENRSPIPSRLYNAAKGGHVAGTVDIIDDDKGKTQDVINKDIDSALENRYTKEETYSKTELNNLITTPSQKYVSVTATNQTTAATDVLPATGAADTVYRVGNWDGSQYDTTCYTEYAWNGSVYVLLNTKEYGIDDKPTAGSDNLVKSGGVWNSVAEIDFNNYPTKVDSDLTISQWGYTGELLQEKLIAGHTYIIAITSETTVSGETIIGCTSQTAVGKIDTITTNANLSSAITYLDYTPTVATRYLWFSTLRSANVHVIIKDKAVLITDNIIAALNETNTKTANLNLKTLAIIPAKNYSVNDVIFTSESILPGTSGKIVGTAVRGAAIGFYDKDDNKLLDSPSLLGENHEVAINVPLGYSYAKVLYSAYTLVSSSEFTAKTDVLMAKELLLEDKSSFKTLVLTKKVYTSTAIYTPIKKGNQYSIDIEFKAAHTNTLRIYIVDSSGGELKTLYEMNSYTSATTKVFTLDRFTADIDGGGIKVQFVGYGTSMMNVSLYNYVYPVDVNKRTIDKQVISRDLTTTQWSYISLIAQGITLKRGENYTITIKHSETVTKSIKFGTDQTSSAMVDVIGDAIEITSEGYTFDYSPTVDVNTIQIATSNALTYNITIVQHVTTYIKESASKPVRFILITDCHYRPYEIDNHSYNDDGHADYTSDADTKWDGVTQNERLQMMFNALKKECQDGSIDFILSTGDTIQGDRDNPTTALGMKLFRERYLSQISTPFFSCVGNHDMMYSDAKYMENFYHHREFSFECGNLYFICPNFCSKQIKVSGSWSPDPLSIHLDWMNTEVAKAKERNMIPILCSHVSQTSDYYDQGAVYSTELYEWMKANDVHLYLVGHQHFIQEEKVSGYDIYRVCAGWFANRDPYYYKDNVTGWGYCVIDFKEGNFKVTQKVVEWNYADTQAKYDEYGQGVEIGDNGYIEQSSTAYNSDVVSCDNLDGAMYRVESMSNFANCEDAIIEVPPMIPVE